MPAPAEPTAAVLLGRSVSPAWNSIAASVDAEGVGADLGRHREHAGAELLRGRSARPRCRRRRCGPARAASGMKNATGYAAAAMPGADQPVAVARRDRGAGFALRPAEPLGAEAQALREPVARPRVAVRVDRRVVAQPQLDRVDPELVRELVHRRLEHRTTPSASPGPRVNVGVIVLPLDQPVHAEVVLARVELRGDAGRRLGPVVERRRDRELLVADRGQPSVARRRRARCRCSCSSRCPLDVNICGRVSISFTGRPTCRAAIAVSVTCGHTIAFIAEPAADERARAPGRATAAGRAGGRPSAGSPGCPWSTRRASAVPPSQTATVDGASIGLWWLAAIR